MAHAIGTTHAFAGAAHEGQNGDGILARIGGFAAALAQEWAVRRDVLAIESLDGRTLADLGIARSEAERAVRFGRGAISGLGRVAQPARSSAPMPVSFTEWR